jgi:hypothetical protein
MPLRGRNPQAPALNGRVICLWAGSVGHEEPAEYQFEIEEAVISLARAVLASGGRLALLADDAVSPLVAQVGGEYAEPIRLETSHAPERGPSPVALIVHVNLAKPTADVLSLLARSGAVDLLVPDPEGRRLAPWEPGFPLPDEHVRDLWHGLVKFAEPIAVVAVAEPAIWMAERDLAMGTGVPGFLVETATSAQLWAGGAYGEVIDVVRRYATPEPGHEEDSHVGARPWTSTPYPFVMQCLVEDLARGNTPGRHDGPAT